MKVLIDYEDFEKQISKTEKTVLVKFYADWCGPCRMVSVILDEIESELSNDVAFFKVNIDSSESIVEKFQINSIPVIILFQKGVEKDRIVGAASKSQILDWIKKYI